MPPSSDRRPPAAAAALAAVFAAVFLATSELGAQPLARRIAAAGDGEVRLSYATRAGVCGDGDEVVGLRGTLHVGTDIRMRGDGSPDLRCVPGSARVAVRVRRGTVEGVQLRVGGAWTRRDGASADLGTVPAAEAAAYFLALAERAAVAERAAAAGGGRAGKSDVAAGAMFAAVVADSADPRPDLLRLARDASLGGAVRRNAVEWLGEIGDASLVPVLTALVRGDAAGERVGSAAVYALGRLPDAAGVPTLTALVRTAPSERLQKDAVFWLGQQASRQAREVVRAAVLDATLPEAVRAQAVFALGNGAAATADDVAFLQRLFAETRSGALREQVLMAVAQRGGAGGARWALGRARDVALPRAVREHAFFWAGQGAVPSAELVAAYDALDDRELQAHALFVLSQREDRLARDKLAAVARGDADRALREKALFWLTQQKDPRAERLIEAALEHRSGRPRRGGGAQDSPR